MNKNWKQENYEKLINKVNKEKLDEVKQKGFTNINNSVITMDIPSTYKVVYMAISSLCYDDKDECFPSNSTIAYLVNKSIRTVQRAVKFLKENNLLKVTSRIGTTNVFTILKKVILSKKDKKRFYKSEKDNTTLKFNDYEQRSNIQDEKYLNKLESKLLGWE